MTVETKVARRKEQETNRQDSPQTGFQSDPSAGCGGIVEVKQTEENTPGFQMGADTLQIIEGCSEIVTLSGLLMPATSTSSPSPSSASARPS